MLRGVVADVFAALGDFKRDDEDEIRNLRAEVRRLEGTVASQSAEIERLEAINTAQAEQIAQLKPSADPGAKS